MSEIMRMRLWIPGLIFCAEVNAVELEETRIEHAGARFRVVRVAPEQLQLVWKGSEGKPLATFEKVRQSFASEGKKLRFIMNAGIFEPGLVPSGLHIEKAERLAPLNLREGKGNFFLKPNGVFLVGKGAEAKVCDSAAFPALETPRLALQSGPLLLMNGKRHPAFRDGSLSVKHRNGVGVDDKGQVVFAMTDKRQEVNFWDFAGLFLKLDCRNALFLDGDISQMVVKPKGMVNSNRFAAMFVVAD